LDRVAVDPDVEMIDRVGCELALAEIPEHAMPRIRDLLPGWVVEPERESGLPEPWAVHRAPFR
jgi:hypothetical protein